MRLRGSRTIVAAVIALVAVTGCQSDDDQGDSPVPAPSSTAPETPHKPLDPETMPAATVDEFGKLKLTVHRPERQADNDAELAIRTWVSYVRAHYKALATDVEDPELAKVASTDELKGLRQYYADRKAKKIQAGGELEITIKPLHTWKTEAWLSGCMDQSGLRIVRPDGTLHPDPRVVTEPEVDMLPLLEKTFDEWRVKAGGGGGISTYCSGGEWPTL